MSGHAKHSPSALNLFEVCPSFVNRNTTSPAAEEGTFLHECVENGVIPDYVTDEQRGLLDLCFAHLATLESRFPVIRRELKLTMCGGITYGTADIVALNEETFPSFATICDWKFGRKDVADPQVNAQGNAYALGLFELYPSLERVNVQFYLPRLDGLLKQHVFSRSDVPWMRERVIYTVERARQREGAFPGQHCRFCDAIATCKELRMEVLPFALKKSGFNLPIDPEKCSMDDLIDIQPILESLASAIKPAAIQKIKDGEELERYTITTRKGKSKVTDAKELFYTLSGDVATADFVSCASTYSINKLIEIAANNAAPKGKKGVFKEDLKNTLIAKGAIEEGAEYEVLTIKVEGNADEPDAAEEALVFGLPVPSVNP